MHNDYIKHNSAILLGWKLLYLMGVDIEVNNTYILIMKAINGDSTDVSESLSLAQQKRREYLKRARDGEHRRNL